MLTFGSDPEFMLTKECQYYSAIGIIQGTTEKRIKQDGHEFYWDNVMAECAVRPGKSIADAVESIRECMRIYADMVRPYQLTVQASQN